MAPDQEDQKLVHSMAGLWRDETRRRKSKMANPDPGSSPFPPEVLVTMSADPRNSQPGGWIHEDEYRDKVLDLIAEEQVHGDGKPLLFESFVKKHPFDSSIKTAFEAVEDLYPENLAPILGLHYAASQTDSNGDTHHSDEVDVDEGRIFGFENRNGEADETKYDEDKKGDPADHREGVAKAVNIIQHDQGEGGLSLTENMNLAETMVTKIGNDSGGSYLEVPSDSLHIPTLSVPTETFHEIVAEDVDRDLSDSVSSSHPTMVQDGRPSDMAEVVSGSLQSGIKRRRSGVMASMVPSKRPRTISNPQKIKAQIALATTRTMKRDFYSPTPSSTPLTVNGISRKVLPSTPTLASSQGKPKKAGLNTRTNLSFPVVKDPHEPSTLQRLSQNSQTSRKSTDGSPEKSMPLDAPPISSQIQLPLNGSQNSANTSEQSSAYSATVSNLLHTMEYRYPSANSTKVFAIGDRPPSALEVSESMVDFGLPPVIYQDAYYSKESDVPDRARVWAGREFKIGSWSVPFLPDFDSTGTSPATFGEKPATLPDRAKEEAVFVRRRYACKLRSWEIGEPPPSYSNVEAWARAETDEKQNVEFKDSGLDFPVSATKKTRTKLSQVEGPTQKNKHGFKYTQKQKTTSVQHESQYMSTMSLEVHVNTRGRFVPNPEEDEVQFVIWGLQSDEDDFSSKTALESTRVGLVVLSEDGSKAQKISQQTGIELHQETTELEVMIRMVEIVRRLDPDILTGYEVHSSSWGYLIERARLKYDYNLCDEFSRMRTQSHGRSGKENDKWGFNNTSTIRVTGRHMINIWRAMRSELSLLQYTMENVAFHLLHIRIPHYSWPDLTFWYTNGKSKDLAKVVDYYSSRVQLDLQILEESELIPRTSEQARLLGVDFFSVFSRGSQFKVESLMFRIAKPENFMLVSPSRKQVGGQNALECLPLVMEPQSAFYNSPLLVLDFQSLYPSIMIAYNYCYSTFLGRVVNWRGTNKMGYSEYKRQQRLLELLKDHINIAPNGIMYVRPDVRKSLLAKMLGEILETRVMVKSGMKIDKDDKTLQRLLNNRQLALKLIANVTYGYTSASFSGRMPCAEIADSIVQTGRETLEKAIALIHSVKRWGAEVVYGDTDSIFVYLKGRTKDQAFDIGNEIAKTITDMNPRPMKLKFEKVYFPCVLLAKKRYVGFKYESRDQKEPEFDAKGIETVRRDGTPAEQKIEEKALKILFQSADLSQVKSYFQRQCEKIMRGSVSIQDFCFAKEVKLGMYSEKGVPPPGALISTKRMLEDHRAEPQYGERVPYVVITGAPGTRLIDRCVAPETLLHSDHNELDAEYYISKNIIPPLERIFNLMGANVRQWYDEMPKTQRVRRVDTNVPLLGDSKDTTLTKKTLESYMTSSSCLVCKEKMEVEGRICAQCMGSPSVTLFTLRKQLELERKKAEDIETICRSCSGFTWADEVKCDSKDCSVFYSRVRQKARLATETAVTESAMNLVLANNKDTDAMAW